MSRRHALRLIAFALFGLLLCSPLVGFAAPPVGEAGPKLFRAGAFAADITPTTFPISVNGGMRDQQANSAHDRLHARVLVLDDGHTIVAIVVCDSCAIPRDLMDEAKRMASEVTPIRPDRILISATHTHEAPCVAAAFQSEPDLAYRQFLVEQIAKGIKQAHSQLEPARIGWAVGRDPTQVFNRRWFLKPGTMPANPFGTEDQVKMNPGRTPNLVKQAGPVDPEISIVSVQARDGRPIALLASYGLHYVGGVAPLSADYFGEFAVQIGKLLGAESAKPAFVGIMANGTSGDVNNVDFSSPDGPRRQPFEQITLVAESVAKATYDAVGRITYRDWVPLVMQEREIELGVRKPSPEEVAKAKAILAAAKKPVLVTLPEVYARETVLMNGYPAQVRAKLQALRIGELGIVSSPCETFTETGLAIKKQSPLQPTFVIELANGYNGYLPTPEQHKLGGYETWRARSSYLEVDASTKIQATLLELLEEVAKQPAD